eukprot:TRINITY_DN93447_c0_g1_i1.p1 TRINITY_DN93447_c0_g1~~TRINITY_DN93447_c0_g1_i1.p1  ORF type:complete len:487 (+),score=113.47 TRINITY_DN93447_c0_g1_i1:39-1499(+)
MGPPVELHIARLEAFDGSSKPKLPLFAAAPEGIDVLDDTELDCLEVEERTRVEELNQQIDELRKRLQCHERRRCRLRRELLRRHLSASPLGQLMASAVPPFLAARDVLNWLSASPAATAQLLAPGTLRTMLHHLRGLNAEQLTASAAQAVVALLHWPSIQTISMDMGGDAWPNLLQALWDEKQRGATAALELRGLQALAVTFPAERSITSLQQWRHCAAPQLSRLSQLLAAAPLQELVLEDLRSTETLMAALAAPCSRLLRVCRASFIGPESRSQPLALPASGLPRLECLKVMYRDFREQRASRQERMQVLAAPLLACLRSIQHPEKLKVLALLGIRIDGSAQETGSLLKGLMVFPGLVAIALRFAVPRTFGTLLPLSSLIKLRCCWPLVGHFSIGDQSLHGFDYWPEQMTDFQLLYPEGSCDGLRVFSTEFRHILRTQYNSTPQQLWSSLAPQKQDFWGQVAARLPTMPHSEVRRRVAELFPTCL